MPKYNLNVELVNLEGQKLITLADPKIDEETGEVVKGEDGQPLQPERMVLTASHAVVKALTLDTPTNLQEDAVTKTNKYKVAKKIKEAADKGEDVTLNSQEIDVVKAAIGKLWGVMTVGAIDAILEA